MDKEKGRISESPAEPDNNGRTGASPSLENLAGENERLKEKLAQAEEQREEMALKLADVEERNSLTRKEVDSIKALMAEGKGSGKERALAKKLLAQAASGDEDAQALIELAEEVADKKLSEIKADLDKKLNTTLTQREMERSFDRRDEFLDEKAKELKLTIKEIKNKLAPFADDRLAPFEEAREAFRKWKREFDLDERDKALKAKEGNGEHEGLEGEGRPVGSKGGKDFTKDWKDAKTDAEQSLSIADL